jgi:uncharacterized protein (TIGR01615 family)
VVYHHHPLILLLDFDFPSHLSSMEFCTTSPSPHSNLNSRIPHSPSLQILSIDCRPQLWTLNTNSCCAGEYEYIDVVFDGEKSRDEESGDRYIVDLDFQAQFEIARPTLQYEKALESLPTVFVGTRTKLKQVLEIMSNAAKVSLKQNSMHLPPWRTLDYMSAKWFSNFERKKSDSDVLSLSLFKECSSLLWRDAHFPVFTSETKKLCGEQLQRTKVSLLGETKGSSLCNPPHGRSGKANLELKSKHFVI